MGDYVDPGQGRIKGRGHKQRKTRIVKKETYSRKDFRGHPNGNEIYDHVTKLIEEEKVEGGKRESIYCTVYKYLQANARKSFIHERTPDLGQDGMGTKETLAVLLSISTKDVDTILGNAGTELKVDVFAEVGEGECKMLRFPIRYYTTAEDLTNYVLKDMGITESVLNYQLAMVKTPYKGKSKFKAMMCAGGATSPYPGSNKTEKVLYPHEHPLQVLDSKLKVIESKDIPKLQSCYFHVTMRPMESLTVFYRRLDGVVQEDTFTLQPSITCHELIEQCLDVFDLKNDLFAYKLIMKAFEFDERMLARNEQPISLKGMDIEFQEGYPIFLIEECDVDTVSNISKPEIIVTSLFGDVNNVNNSCSNLRIGGVFENDLRTVNKPMYLSLRDISGDDHSNKNEIHALERRVEKLARSNERCREKLSNVTQLYEVERVKVEKGEGRRNKAKVRYERVKLELREVKDDNQFIRNGMLTLEAQNERYTIDNEALLDQLCTLKKRVDKYEKDTANRQLIFQNTLEVSQHEHKRSRSIIGLSDTESTSTPRVSTEKPPEMETNISGTLTRFKNRVEELEQERITLRERDQVLTAKLSSVESQLGLKCEELASVDVVIEALNSEIRESRERCQGNECPSSQRLLEELASHQAVGTQGQNQLALNRAKRVELSNEMIRAKSQLAEMEGTLCEVRRENEQLRRDTESDKGPAAGASLLTETVALKGKLAEVKKSRMAIQDELGDHKLRVAELELELEDELEKRVPRSESEVVRGLQEELRGFKAKYVELGNEIIQAKNQERDATTAVKKLTTQNRILEREAKHAEKELAEKTEQCKNGQCSYAQNMVKDNELQVKIYKDLHTAISQKEEEYKELKEEITTLDQSLIRIVKVEEREWTIKMRDEKVQEMQTVQKKKEEYQEVLHDHVTEIIDKGCAGCMHLMDKCGKYKDSRELIKEEFIELKLVQADREGEETDTINEIKQALKLQHDSEISKVKLELEGLEMRRKELSDAFKETQKKYLSEVMKNSDLEEDLEEVNGRVGEMEEKITQLEKSSKTNSGQAKHLNKPRSVLNMKSIFEPKP